MMDKKKKLIGWGRKRKVYDLGNGYVLKVAKSKAGLLSNKTEFLLYHSKRAGHLRKHLGKVTKYGHRWLIMKKYVKPFCNSSKYRKKYRILKRKFRQSGIYPLDMYSMTHKGPSLTNLRLNYKGEIIVIDYGNFKFTSRH
jgi:hypothetical protein